MIDFTHYADALGLVFQVQVIAAIAGGTVLGIVFGALPGLTAAMGIAVLLPLTYNMPPVMGFGMLLGTYCGAISGGSIAATLLNIPGTPASVATTLDAYPMARKGEAGRALGIAIVASFIGGLFSSVVLSLAAPPIAEFALKFGAAEYFSLAVFGLTIIASVSGKSLAKGVIAGLIGVFVSLVGLDPTTGSARYTFGEMSLLSGVAFLPALIGLFAVGQVLTDAEEALRLKGARIQQQVGGVHLRFGDVLRRWKIVISSCIVGTSVGAIPGAGGSVASFLAYDQARRLSKTPELFGTGHDEGVIASETSNNAMTGGAIIPTITLGVPGEAAAAVLMGGLMIHGLRPGPLLFTEQADIVYGIFMAFFLANIFMMLFQFVGIRLFVKVLGVPRSFLIPIILMFCVIGSYGVSGNIFDMYLLLVFGVLGFFLNKYGYGTAPVVLGMILGTMAETEFRKGMIMFSGDGTVFFTRPISLLFLALALISVLIPLYQKWRDGRARQSKS
ncbi:MAG: tripartite tricarboxylate transporter permease [Rhodospirillales bacterium]|jgi:putative tricarboxylic transport membrane protein|nr:tripartite tricarboxylate transporter permease [Rhodospirillales bacterium]